MKFSRSLSLKIDNWGDVIAFYTMLIIHIIGITLTCSLIKYCLGYIVS